MAKIEKFVFLQDLAHVQALITDSDPNSQYFRISDLPDVLTGGKNSFLINGSTVLVSTTEVKVELTDFNGNTVYLDPIKNYQEGLARVISIEVYEDTPPGPAVLTILGHTSQYIDGTPIPPEWQDKYNVKWQRNIVIDPLAINTTKIRLYEIPEISAKEHLVTQQIPVTSSMALISGSGTLLVVISPPPTGSAPSYVLNSPTLTFDNSMVGGIVYAPVYQYTGSIISLLNANSAVMNSAYNTNLGFDLTPVSLSYQPTTTYISSDLTQSFTEINLTKLTTFSGDIKRAKIYVKAADRPDQFSLIEDTQLEAQQLLVTASSMSGNQLVLMGEFSNPSIINSYWTAGTASVAGYVSSGGSASIDSSIVLNAATLGQISQNSTNPQYYFGTSVPINFVAGAEYSVMGTLAGTNTSTNTDAVCAIYMSGSAFSSSDPLGTRIQQFVVPAGTSFTRFNDINFNIISPRTGAATLQFVVYGGQWYFADVNIDSATETGFNPDSITIFTDQIPQLGERIILKAELFDSNSNIVPVLVQSDPLYLDGGDVDTPQLSVQATVIDTAAGSITVFVIATDPLGIATPFITASVQPANIVPITGTNPYVITRPPSSTGSIRAVFTATAPGRLEGFDSVDVAPIPPTPADVTNLFISLVMNVVSSSATNEYVSASVINPSAYPYNVSVASTAGTIPVSQGDWSWILPRPASGSATVLFRATSSTPNVIDDYDTVYVDSTNNPPLSVIAQVTSSSATSITASVSVRDPLNPSGVLAGIDLIPLSQSLTNFNIITGSITNTGGIYNQVFYITRPDYGQGTGRATFFATKSGYTPDADSIEIPESVVGLASLICTANISAMDSSTMTISASASDPVGGSSPSIGVGIQPVGSVTFTGTNPYIVNRPLAGSVRFVVSASKAGRNIVYDSVDIPASAVVDTGSFISLIMNVASSSATSTVVSASVVNINNYPIGISLISSTLVAPVYNAPGIWTIARPSTGVNLATFSVTSSTVGVLPDYDEIYTDSGNTTNLNVIAKVTAVTSASITASVDVRDPFTPSGPVSGITLFFTTQSLTNFSAVTGSITNTNGVYNQIFYITRPDYGQGTGRITFFATKSGYTEDADSIEIPESVTGLATLNCIATITAMDASTITVSASAVDPIGGASPAIGIGIQPAGSVSFTGTNPYVINRPNAGSVRAVFTATKTNRVSGYDSVDIPSSFPVTTGSFLSLVMSITTSSATSVTVSGSVINPLNYPIGVSLVTSSGISPVYVSPGIWTISRPVTSSGYSIFSVTSSTAGVISDYDEVFVDSSNTANLNVIASVVGVTSASLTASVNVQDPLSPFGIIQGIDLFFTTQSLSGFSVVTGSITNTGSFYTQIFYITRPDYGQGTGRVTFYATKSGYTQDADSVEVPESVTGLANLSCTAIVTAMDANTMTISASAVDPVGGTSPIIAISIQPTGAVTGSGLNPYIINRPAAGSVRVNFTATKTNRVAAYDSVDIPASAAVTTGSFLTLVMNVIGTSATASIVSSSVINPNGYPVGVSLVSANSVVPIYTSPGVWAIPRPATGTGLAIFSVTSSTAGVIPDYDDVYVDSGNDPNLSVIAKVTAVTSASITASVDVRDPYSPTGTVNGVTLFFTTQSLTGFSATAQGVTNSGGVYNQVFYITRPSYGQGTGRITFFATKSGYTEDADSIEIPENITGIATVVCNATITAMDASTITISASAYDPVSNVTTPIGGGIQPVGATTFTGTNPYVVTRPNAGSVRFIISSSAAGRNPGYDSVDIPSSFPVTTGSFLSLIMNVTTASATSIIVSGSVINPLNYPIGISLSSFQGVSPIYNSPGIWTINRPSTGSALVVFSVTSSTAGVIPDYDEVYADAVNRISLSTVASVVGVTSGSITASVNVIDPYTPTGSIAGINLSFTTQSLTSFTAITGSITNANGIYNQIFYVTRPDYGQGTGRITFTATKSGYTPDADSIEIPESVTGLGAIICIANITAMDATTMTISASAVDPIGGTSPSIGGGVQPANAVTFTGTNPYVVNRPPVGSVRFIVSGSKANRNTGYDSVDIPSSFPVTTGSFLTLVMAIVSSSATASIVTSSVINPLGYPIGISLVSSTLVTPVYNSPGIWTIPHPSVGTGLAIFSVTSSTAGVIPDYDDVYIDSGNTTNLQVIAFVTAVTSASITASVNVRDPFNLTGQLSGITLNSSSQALTGLTAITGSVTNANGVYNQVFYITRPDYGQGTGRVTFYASKSGYTPDADSIEIPESVTGLATLYVVASITAMDATTMTISASAVDPVGGTSPTIAASVQPAGVTSFTGTNPYVVTRPLAGSVRFTVTGSKPNRVIAYDSVDIPSSFPVTTGSFLTLVMTIVSSSATSSIVTSSVINPLGYPIGISLVSSTLVTPVYNAPGTWTIPRPTTGTSLSIFSVTSSTAGIIPDYDDVYVDSGNSTTLQVIASVTAVTSASITASVGVRDPFNISTALTGITLNSSSQALTGLAVTTGSVTNAGGVYSQIFYVVRPDYGQGTGRVTFFASKSGYTPDADSIEIPENVSNLAQLTCKATITATDTSTITVSASAVDPVGGASPAIALDVQPVGSVSTSGTNPYVINRPLSGSVRVNFTATKTNRIAAYDSVDVSSVPPIGTGSFLTLVMNVVSSSAASILVSGSVINPAGYAVGISQYSATNITPINQSPGIWSISRPGSGSGFATFQVTSSAVGVLPDYDLVYVDSANLTALSLIAQVSAITSQSVTASVTVRDPFSPSGSLSGITLNSSSQAAVSGLSVVAGSITNGNGTYNQIFYITRPDYGQGTGRVTFYASKSNYTPDGDSIDIPESVTNLAQLTCKAFVTSMDTFYITVSASASDPIGGAAPTLLYDIQPVGLDSENLCLQSETIGTAPWQNDGPATITSNTTTSSIGTITADTITRAVAASDAIHQTIGFTGDGTKAFSYYIKQGTSNVITSGIFDNTKSAWRHRISLAWTGGVPVLTDDLGAGSLYTPVAAGNGWYRIAAAANSVTGSNTNIFYLFPSPAGANGDTVILWGVQIEDSAQASPYIGTTSSVALGGITVTGSNPYLVSRPQSGSARMNFTATKANRVTVTDSVDIPSTALIGLSCVASVTAMDFNSVTISASANDPLGGTSPSLSFAVQPPGAVSVSGTNPYTVIRPVTGSARVIFTATKAPKISATDSVDISATPTASLGTGSFLSLIMHQVSSSATSITVSGSIVNPRNVPTTVAIYDVSAVSPSSVSTNAWIIARPGSGMGWATFQVTSTTPGIISDEDTVYVNSSNLTPLSVIASVIGVSSGSITSSVNVTDPFGSTSSALIGITLNSSSQALSGFTTTAGATTNANGVYNQIVYTTRPNYGQGTGRVTFIASKSGYTPDSDSVEVPESVTNLAHLHTVASITSMTNSQLSASVVVTDPVGGTTPTIGFSIQPANAVSVTGTNPYNITRPISGSARVIFTGSAPGRIDDIDSIDVPSGTQAQAALDVRAVAGGGNVNVYYSYTGSISLSINNGSYVGLGAASASSPITVVRTGVFSGPAAGDYYDFKVVGFDGQILKDGVLIPPNPNVAVTPNLTVTPGSQTPLTQDFTVSTFDPAGSGQSLSISMTLVNCTTTLGGGTGPFSLSSPQTVTINRPIFTNSPATATFVTTMNGFSETIQRTILNADIDTAGITGSIGQATASFAAGITGSIGQATASLSASQAAATTAISASIVGKITGSGATATTFPVFYNSNVNLSTNIITLTFTAANLPGGGSVDLMVHQYLANNANDERITVTNITSPYSYNTNSPGTIDLVTKGTSGYSTAIFEFTAVGKDSGGGVTGTDSFTTSYFGLYNP